MGASRISITFTLDRNLDEAANDVRDAVSRVLTQIAGGRADAPRIAKANADSSPLMFLTFTSPTMSRLELSDYANRYLVQRPLHDSRRCDGQSRRRANSIPCAFWLNPAPDGGPRCNRRRRHQPRSTPRNLDPAAGALEIERQ